MSVLEGYAVAGEDGDDRAFVAEASNGVRLEARGFAVLLSPDEAQWLARRIHRVARRVRERMEPTQ